MIRPPAFALSTAVCVALLNCPLEAAGRPEPVDLLERYPTTLTSGTANSAEARPWRSTAEDIYELARFSLKAGRSLNVQISRADLAIGHCTDGAVWAVVVPRVRGALVSPAGGRPESIDHVWLRFHPKEVTRLFPKQHVRAGGDRALLGRVQQIAAMKMRGSWQAGGLALIPGRKDLTVDMDTKERKRRFFVVDIGKGTARYVSAFENRPVPSPKPLTRRAAQDSFDKLWKAYDRQYAMFAIRPGVDWNKLREQYRPRALRSETAVGFASVCAEMLAHLRDLHVWVKVDGMHVPVFDRPRQANANPSAYESVIGRLTREGRRVRWGRTADGIGFVAVGSWDDDKMPEQFDRVLARLRDTKGLIVDVRLSGGGSEPLAQKVAGRFVEKKVVYSYSQYRSGPKHSDLTRRHPRTVEPRGPWRYEEPVIVLIGQRCMSSTESFVAMMAECPQVTTMGDHTCGSSGNPTKLELSAGITVSLPRWIDYLPDGEPLDERGVQPDVRFKPAPGAFGGKRDDLLAAAVARLRRQSRGRPGR